MADHAGSIRSSIKSLLAMLVVVSTCLAVRLISWSVSFSANLWLLLPWKPALINKAFHGLLLQQVHLQERLSNFAELLWVLTVSERTADAFELKEPAGCQSHNGENTGSVMAESPVFSHLSYYCVSEIPNILAIVRYSASNDHDQIMAVAEDNFYDNEEEYARLQAEVEDALLTGVDVAVMSSHEPEYFPTIWGYLADDSVV